MAVCARGGGYRNAWPLEVVVYVPVWSLAEMARNRETTMAAVLAELGGRAS